MLLFPKRYIGRSFQGYKLEKSLGQGRYGSCFAARSAGGRLVVLKRLHNPMKKKNTGKNHFEPVILSMLRHPAVPELLGIVNEGRSYFFVLEYMPGISIKQLLFSRRHPFTYEEIHQIMVQLLDLIAYLHHKDIVHRDIRISNVLWDPDQQRLSLVDFGLARFAHQEHALFQSDFSYLGDFFLYLLYALYPVSKGSGGKQPWYRQLPLSAGQMEFLKRLLGLSPPYSQICSIRQDFLKSFTPPHR